MDAVLSRRQFLQFGAALVVGFSLEGPGAAALAAELPAVGRAPKDFKRVNAWLAIDGAGRVTVYSGHVDLGTGVETAFTQMVSDELDVPPAAVTIVQGDTRLTPDQGPTWGSVSVQVAGVALRKAAACARHALMERAAKQLGVAAGGLTVRNGVIAGGGKEVTYARLIAAGGDVLDVPFDDSIALKSAAAHTVIGTSMARVDIPAKVTGEFTYMQDFRVEGMLHGRVIHPTGLRSHLEAVDDSEARKIPGFVRTVVQGDFVGVVARTEWGAVQAMGAVKCRWSDWHGLPAMAEVYGAVRKTPVRSTLTPAKSGDVEAALGRAARTLRATYEFPVQTHGSIGPSCAVADVTNEGVRVWSASQATHWLQRQLAGMLSMPPERIRVIYLEGAGCYGRNSHEDAAADAVLLSKAVGLPVRVQWMRQDEHGWDPKSPPMPIDVQGALDERGDLVAWRFENWLPYFQPGSAVDLLAQALSERHANVQKPGNMIPGSIAGNAAPPYRVPNVLAVCHQLETTPFRASWLRGPGWAQNNFANESFMDELAAAAGADPVEFRLRHLGDARGVACIRACAEKAGWQARPSPNKAVRGDVATGRGFAYVFYDNKRTYVAAACEVEVDRKSGHVRATRFTVAHDCGLIVNPDGVKAQVEGSVVQTLSRTLLEEVLWDDARVTSVDWASYPILRFPDVPKIETVLINRPDEHAWGVGEPTCSVVACAVGNAIFDATGVRLRTVPFTDERVKAALRA